MAGADQLTVPLVSVVLTVHKRLTFFAEALRSIEAQTFQDYEIVIADDSGTAAARDACRVSNNGRVRYHANSTSLGVALSVRAALATARGKYIAILNDDDLWEPDFLARLVPVLEADAKRVLAFCDHAIIAADGRIDEAATRRNTERFGRSSLAEGDVAEPKAFVLRHNGVPLAMGSLFRAGALAHERLVSDVAGAYDFWMSSVLAASGGNFYYVPARLSRYRVHADMETARRDPEKTRCLAFIARSLLAEPAFANEREYLARWLSSLTVRAGRDYLYFDRVADARRSFATAFRMSAGWKPVAGYLVSMVPASLRRVAGVTVSRSADLQVGQNGRMKVLYFCEGYTDIRFVVGLSEICDLTMAIPERHLHESGLADRLVESAARVRVDTIKGGRLAFQWRSVLYLLRKLRSFDVVLSQEMGRGSLSATAVGKALGTPVVLYLGTSPVEYFHCRRVRGQVGPFRAWASETFLATAMKVTGALASAVVTTGPYLGAMAARMASRVIEGYYCGIDTSLFRPVSDEQRARLRERLQFPAGKFVILFPSRISHEKDPETVLKATAAARGRGLDAVVMNLGGGFRDFLACAERLGLPGYENWVIGRPAVHPMKNLCEYMQAADVVVQASLAEGGGMSPLEALSCGTPVIATRVGGMALTLPGIAQLVAPGDAAAMADAFEWVSRNIAAARHQALRGREYVEQTWSRDRAFASIATALEESNA